MSFLLKKQKILKKVKILEIIPRLIYVITFVTKMKISEK